MRKCLQGEILLEHASYEWSDKCTSVVCAHRKRRQILRYNWIDRKYGIQIIRECVDFRVSWMRNDSSTLCVILFNKKKTANWMVLSGITGRSDVRM